MNEVITFGFGHRILGERINSQRDAAHCGKIVATFEKN